MICKACGLWASLPVVHGTYQIVDGEIIFSPCSGIFESETFMNNDEKDSICR